LHILHAWHLEIYSEVAVLSEELVWVTPEVEPRLQDLGNAKERVGGCDDSGSGSAIVIRGVTHAGLPFRPSDWCQRLAAAATINCSYCSDIRGRKVNPHVKVVIDDGIHSLLVSRALVDVDPPLYDFMIMFGKSNGLQLYFDGLGEG